METEMKITQAETHLDIWVVCPYCNHGQSRWDDLREHLDTGELRAESCEAELVCEDQHCGRTFMVNKISY